MSTLRPPASVYVQGLTHRYPGAATDALHDVAFTVEPGERLGLLGPNGAGKSTLMRIVCGYLPVASAQQTRVEVGKLDVRRSSLQVRASVGYMPEQVPLYAELRVLEHLGFRARIKRVGRKQRRSEIERVAALTGLSDKLQTPISQLSRGYRQRVGIADALLGSPPLLILDEPTVGLDPNQVLEIRAMLREVGGSQTLVFSSHILAEVEALCDKVVILSRGRVVADERLDDALAAAHVTAHFAVDRPTAATIVTAAGRTMGTSLEQATEYWPHTASVTGVRVSVAQAGVSVDTILAGLGRASVEAGHAPRLLAPGRTRLEQRFAQVTGADDDNNARA